MATYSDPFTFDHPVVKAIIERLTAANTKCTSNHIESSTKVAAIAEWYAFQYNGSYPFMKSLNAAIKLNGSLSVKQAASAINCMVNDYNYFTKREREISERAKASSFVMPEATLPDPPMLDQLMKRSERINPSEPVTPACLNGTYTIVLNEAGEYRTLRLVDCPEHFNKAAGTQIAQYLSGADNEASYTGFAFVAGSQIAVWSKFKADSKLAKALQVLISSDRESQIDLGEAYALASGKCFVCDRKLTVPASVTRGLGPVCAEKFGL